MPPKCSSSLYSILAICVSFLLVADAKAIHSPPLLRFGQNGRFKILQVADMHYADGKSTPCEDVLPGQVAGCSDLNTTAFVRQMIRAENPDLIVFTGTTTYTDDLLDRSTNATAIDENITSFREEQRILVIFVDVVCKYFVMAADASIDASDNIYGPDATDAAESLNAAFASAISSGIPWAAVLGNHDQESTLSRGDVMRHIVQMDRTVSRLNPTVDSCSSEEIDGFGNYNLEVAGVAGSGLQNKSVLNLYFLDSGDYSTVPSISGYGWIKPSQQLWFQRTSYKLQVQLWLGHGSEYRYRKAYRLPSKRIRYGCIVSIMREYMSGSDGQKQQAPGLAYFHIPLPEFSSFDTSNFTGVKQEGISSASINSGFFPTMVEAGDVKAVFTGHDHVNDFCGKLMNINLCYAGGFGYHAYGKAGWSRRARVVLASLEKTEKGGWGVVKSIKTWKRLDDPELSTIDFQTLWINSSTGMLFST
ncbi:hypothetical protein ACLOJK_005544 [Asimina triloba]